MSRTINKILLTDSLISSVFFLYQTSLSWYRINSSNNLISKANIILTMFILANLFPLLLQHHAELVTKFARPQEKYSRIDCYFIFKSYVMLCYRNSYQRLFLIYVSFFPHGLTENLLT